jgi:hypothetical protein
LDRKTFLSNTLDDVDKYFHEGATYRFIFDRNENDDYIMEIETVGNSYGHSLTKSDTTLLIPPGSRHIQGLGWRSIFGIPIYKKDTVWLAIGAEVIVPHPKRGAFPRARAYIFQAQYEQARDAISNNLYSFINNCLSNVEFEGQALGIRTRGIINGGEPLEPKNHFSIEKSIINVAAQDYIQNHFSGYSSSIQRPFLVFRTLLLTEDHYHKTIMMENPVNKFMNFVPIVRDNNFLLSFIESVLSNFSPKAQTEIKSYNKNLTSSLLDIFSNKNKPY